MARLSSVPAVYQTKVAFRQIDQRMRSAGVDIMEYMDASTKPSSRKLLPYGIWAGDTTLQGIRFLLKRGQPPLLDLEIGKRLLLKKLRSARRSGGKTFREGNRVDRPNWAHDLSFGVTPGIGFREILYLPVVDQDRRRAVTGASSQSNAHFDKSFSVNFGQTRAKLDITSLHISVWESVCSIHIDHAGFSLSLPSGNDVFVSPDVVQHMFVELLQRDALKFPKGFEIFLPNSRNDFSSTGVRATKQLMKNLNVNLQMSLSFLDQRSKPVKTRASTTANLEFRF
ncbi:MAG: hypothetical protein AAGI88_03410 [Pseudomonadota bacterium]